jgi:hypothetical protein
MASSGLLAVKFTVFGGLALFSACFATTQANAVESGICIGKFGTKCGELTVRGGKAVSYRYGSCKNNSVGVVTYSSSASQSGNTVKIDLATFVIAQSTAKSISGKWSLRGNTRNITFNCK